MMTRRAKAPGAITLQFTPAELGLVCEALDSHIYWELSDTGYRNSGYVDGPGSEDDETAAMISEAEALQIRLGEVLRAEQAAKTKGTESR
jgi:hypothetical protein